MDALASSSWSRFQDESGPDKGLGETGAPDNLAPHASRSIATGGPAAAYLRGYGRVGECGTCNDAAFAPASLTPCAVAPGAVKTISVDGTTALTTGVASGDGVRESATLEHQGAATPPPISYRTKGSSGCWDGSHS